MKRDIHLFAMPTGPFRRSPYLYHPHHAPPPPHPRCPFINRRLELFQRLGTAVGDGPALLTEAFGPMGCADPFSQISSSVHIPSFDGYGLHAVAANASYLHKLNATFLDKRTLHLALAALYVLCGFVYGFMHLSCSSRRFVVDPIKQRCLICLHASDRGIHPKSTNKHKHNS